MQIETFYDPATFTLTYVVFDEATKDAVVIDSVKDFDPNSGKLTNTSVEKVLDFVRAKKLKVHYLLETHAHADHLTGAKELKKHFPQAKIAISEKITMVQDLFSRAFNRKDIKADGHQFDQLIKDGDVLQAGALEIKGIATPGHTPACMTFHIGDALFTGDALFMPDFGTGRCDFPAGSATDLYKSVHGKLYQLPDQTRIFVGHDYQPGGRDVKWETTVGESKKSNIHIKASTSMPEFVKMREARDAQLAAPRLLLPSIQVNITAGDLPPAEDNGTRYLKLPLKEV